MPMTKRIAASQPPQRRTGTIDGLREENRWLKSELFLTRRALIELLDPQDLLNGYFACDDYEQLHQWKVDRADAVITEAWVRPGIEMGDPRWPRSARSAARAHKVRVVSKVFPYPKVCDAIRWEN
jgi:hypothetical protein